jgi:hypothetical protein
MSASFPLALIGREGFVGMIGVDMIGEIRRAYFEQHWPIKDEMQYMQAKIEIGAEVLFLDMPLQVAVGRGNDPYVGVDIALRTEGLELVVLQEAQQLGLGYERERVDLIEEQRAFIG